MHDELPSLISDPQGFDGKRVLVTGGTTGIGRAMLNALASRGARVLTFGRDEGDLTDTLTGAREAGGEVHGLTADVSSLDGVREVFAEVDRWLGGLDILVNNAAVVGEEFREQSLENIDYVVRTNVVGYLACANQAVQRMTAEGGGQVVLIGSMSADLREEGSGTYVATKGAIQAFSESLRKATNEQNVRVVLIEPGKVATDLVGRSKAEMEESIAQLKMLRPEDIASAVLFALMQPERCDIVSMQIRPHLQVI